VKAFTNAESVELLLNGKRISEQKVDPYAMVSWQVPYAPGRLEAIAKKGGKVVARNVVETTGAAVRLQLLPDRAALAGDGWDAEPVTVQAVDAQGRLVPTANVPVDFEIAGGRIIGLGNGDPNSHEPEKGTRRSLFNGLAQVIVQTLPGTHGPLTLRATSSGLEPAHATLRVDSVAPRPAVEPVGASAEAVRVGGSAGAYQKTSDGLIVTPANGVAKRVRLLVISPKIIRVTAFPTEDMALPASLMAVRGPDPNIHFEVSEQKGAVVLSTGEVNASVSLATGRVSLTNASGKRLVSEVERGESFTPVQVQGSSFYAIRQRFQSAFDEAFYGLGQHQSGLVNYQGHDVELAQHNMDIAVPLVVSSRHYGILWDNNSITRFGDPREWEPLSSSLKLTDAHGKPGGLTARYYVDGKLVLERTERDLDYAFNESKPNFPPGLEQLPRLRVVWEGQIEAPVDGVHKFSLYASDYNRLFIDGRPIIDAWRQGWNPWYRDFDVQMKRGQPRALRIEWDRDGGGYLALLHRSPLPADEQRSMSWFSEVARAVDYYFIAGSNADEVISGYRTVTGKATLLPRWAYGFWQSRDHYEKQDELLGVVKEYRKRGIPLDNIVQDWRYWKDDSWGSHAFDPARYPDPRAMVDEVHSLHANMMISVWAKFYPTTDHFKELDAKGYIYHRNLEVGQKDWVGPGYLSSFYDPYAEEARQIYWRQINQSLNSLGIDAWWLDSDEPDIQSNVTVAERKLRMGPTAMGPGAEFFNSYPLMHTGGVYQGTRAANGGKRVFILSRSGFAGLQRNAAAVWSGDVAPRWSDLKAQIAAGIGAGLSGLPNWTTDIGGYQPETRYLKPNESDLREWRELNTRWFEFAAFSPLFRSHGQAPYREIFNLAPEGSEMYDTLVSYDKLRYRLLPYIYTLAADTWHRDYTIMRGLFMDFPADPQVRDVADEYLFGPAFLVSPVYEYGARQRTTYLPAGSGWYDFYDNQHLAGGRAVTLQAPLNRIPLFVREGSIVPLGPEIQYTGEKPEAPLTILVYTGRNGSFSLYEDEGTNYHYEQGAFSRIPFSYDEAKRQLTIGRRTGEFPGMVRARVFNVRWISAGSAAATDVSAQPDQSVHYNGEEVVVRRR
jgi:alpha-D-xyloside xylohydrolase